MKWTELQEEGLLGWGAAANEARAQCDPDDRVTGRFWGKKSTQNVAQPTFCQFE
jgi:hypothetical protein